MGYEDVRRPAAVGKAADRDSMYEELSLEEELPARVTAALFRTSGRIFPPIFQGEGSALNWPASLSNFLKKLFRFCKFYWDGRERHLAKRAREKILARNPRELPGVMWICRTFQRMLRISMTFCRLCKRNCVSLGDSSRHDD